MAFLSADFEPPAVTAVANRVLDELVVDVDSMAEIRVILFAIRHTYRGGQSLDVIEDIRFVNGLRCAWQTVVWDMIVDGSLCARWQEDAKGKSLSRSARIDRGNMTYPRLFTLLHRINPERNEHRFYAVQVGPSLFDEHAVLRLWGRIGGYQRQMVTPCQSPDDAQVLARQLIQRRLQHGYQILKGREHLD